MGCDSRGRDALDCMFPLGLRNSRRQCGFRLVLTFKPSDVRRQVLLFQSHVRFFRYSTRFCYLFLIRQTGNFRSHPELVLFNFRNIKPAHSDHNIITARHRDIKGDSHSVILASSLRSNPTPKPLEPNILSPHSSTHCTAPKRLASFDSCDSLKSWPARPDL